MKLLCTDYESYWATDYTLSKMTTEAYVRDPRFQVIMVGVYGPDTPAQWFSGTHDQTRQFLGDNGYEDSAVIHHHAHFDDAITSWHLNLRPKFIIDTLSMARPIHGAVMSLSLAKLCEHYGLGAKGTDTLWARGLRREDFTPQQLETYGGYCATREDSDCKLTWRLYQKLKPRTTPREMALIDATIRLFSEPRLVLDRAMLEEHLSSVRAEKARLLATIAGTPEMVAKKALMSNNRFAALLEEHGVTPPMKISKTTGKEAFAFAKTDQGMTDLLEHEDPAVQTLVAARLGTKSTIEETRTERLIGIAGRGTFPIPLSYCGAITTLRWSGTDKINPQNFTRGGAIRKAIMAPPGQVIVVGDSAGIELRVNHTLAGQQDSIAAFREGRDLYCEFASALYGRAITKADHDERFIGKVAELQLGYQCGSPKYKETVRRLSGGKNIMDDSTAENTVNFWRRTRSSIVENNWGKAKAALTAMYQGSLAEVGAAGNYPNTMTGALVWTWTQKDVCGFECASGHRIQYHDLQREARGWSYFTNRGRKQLYEGKAVENIVQWLSRIIIAEQWLMFQSWLQRAHPRWHVVLQVHDELVAVGPEDEAPEVAAALERILSTSPKWWPDLPLAAETGFHQRYGFAKS